LSRGDSWAAAAIALALGGCMRIYVNTIPLDGSYTFTSRAIAGNAVVAVSPDSAPFTITRGAVTDLGTLTLSPCGAGCPPPGL